MASTLYDEFYKSSGICTDTREIQKDCLFICIKGENFDGNVFAEQALEQGASHVIVDDASKFTDSIKMTLVENSVTYLQNLANYHRLKFDIPVIGITGSNGKTTSKELIHTVLSKKFNVLATKGNLNNHLGVPFTLLRLNEEHDIAIIEMGANKFKDIEELCIIAEPTHGLITNIGKAHLEGFIDFDGVLKTKRELYEAVERNHGTILFNSDDEILMNELPASINSYSYGMTGNNDVSGTLLSLSPFVEMNWETDDYKSDRLVMQMIGKYNFYNYLSAIAFGKLFGVENKEISDAITEYTPTNNRSQVKKTEVNTLIMDCYNANPTSMRSALDSFAMINHDDKVAILGDMKELGAESGSEHAAIGTLLEKLNIKAYTVGAEFASVSSPQIFASFETTTDFLNFLESNELRDKLILLKGSRSIGLEKAQHLL